MTNSAPEIVLNLTTTETEQSMPEMQTDAEEFEARLQAEIDALTEKDLDSKFQMPDGWKKTGYVADERLRKLMTAFLGLIERQRIAYLGIQTEARCAAMQMAEKPESERSQFSQEVRARGKELVAEYNRGQFYGAYIRDKARQHVAEQYKDIGERDIAFDAQWNLCIEGESQEIAPGVTVIEIQPGEDPVEAVRNALKAAGLIQDS